MKIIKKTKTETIITGVELTFAELIQKLKDSDAEISFELPVHPDSWDNDWASNPMYDNWTIDGNTLKIAFSDEEEDLPRYCPPETTKKKVVKKK